MFEYPKIETLFQRDEKFNLTDKIKSPVIEIIKTWQVTEKIDGMNVRIMLDKEGNLKFDGRNENSSMPSDLVKYLYETFDKQKMKEVFWLPNKHGVIEPVSVVLYGECYGPGIQKGGYYRKDKAFRLFDVLIAEKYWLNWTNVCDVAQKLGIKTVPYLGDWTLDDIIRNVRDGIFSDTATQDSSANVRAEGIVGRTIEPLFDKRGNRLIIKLKTKDFVGK